MATRRGARRPGSHDNKRLACAICGMPMLRDKIQLWLMTIHFELWHDTDKIEFVVIERNTPIDVPEPIDMSTSQEIMRTLEAIGEAIVEARKATGEAHQATKDLKHAVKESTRDIRAEIAAAVLAAVGELTEETRESMRTGVDGVISRLETDWRAKLGLEA